MNKAIFFDKDNTLIKDIPYNINPALIEPFPETVDAIRILAGNGFMFFIITNQSGVARGYYTEQDLKIVEAKMQDIFIEAGVRLDGFYYCPHYEDGAVVDYAVKCDCRKPETGLFIRAAKEHNLDLSKSWSVGDILNDIEPANRLGSRTVLIDNGGETEWLWSPMRKPDYAVGNILEAAQIIKEKL